MLYVPGDETVSCCPVELSFHIEPRHGEIILTTPTHQYRCQQLIITAGAWSNHHLAHFGYHLPLTITQEQVNYFHTPDLQPFAPERFPVWIWMDNPSFYGFPIFGEQAVKVAQDVGGEEVTADTRTFDPNPHTLNRISQFLQQVK